jgi:transposase
MRTQQSDEETEIIFPLAKPVPKNPRPLQIDEIRMLAGKSQKATMLQISAQSKIYFAVEPADFRRGIDGLAALCRQHFQQNPMSGNIYVFRNRRGNALKVLFWDEQGWWLAMKRLARGSFRWRPDGKGAAIPLSPKQLQVLLWNGNPDRAAFQTEWRKVE